MSPAILLLLFFTCIFCKKIVRWRSRKKWKLRVRHVSQQDSSIKGNYSAALGIHQKKTNPGFTALVSYFGWITSKTNLSSRVWKKEQCLVMYLGTVMLWAGMVVCLDYLLLWSVSVPGLCMLEKHILLNFLFFRVADPGWPPGFLRQWRGSHMALQTLPSPNMRPLWFVDHLLWPW